MADNKMQREIAIFWDYENVPLPLWCSATQAAKAIVDAVSHYGRIVDRRLYYDFEKMQYRPRDCSSLDSSGFDLVNTPTRNNKETLDKKLIADVLTFAWDSAVRNDNTKPCVVLLTGDGDYAYTLSKLRDRGIMTVVMVGRDCTVASILVDTADVAMSLEDDVLRSIDAKPSTTVSSSLSSKLKTVSPTKAQTGTSNNQDALMASICRDVENGVAASEDDWIDFGRIAALIQRTIRQTMEDASPNVIKEEARKARQQAEANQYIEIGRRKLGSKGDKREIIASNDPKLNLSNEVYVRLLPKGKDLLTSSSSPRNHHIVESPKLKRSMSSTSDTANKSPSNRKRILFLPRLAKGSDVRDFVKFLEETFHVTVRRAWIETSNSAPTLCNAHVEFLDEKDAGVILQAANKAAGGEGICFNGKSAGAMANTRSDPFPPDGRDTTFYDYGKLHEKAPSTHSPAPTKPSKNPTEDVTVDDSKKFCVSVYLAATHNGQHPTALDTWANSGQVGEHFRSQLRPTYLKEAAKEQVNTRFKYARNKAIQDGLVEMGRRDLNDNAYVAVALDSPSTRGGKLSPEYYFHLLTPGQKLAAEAESESPSKSSLSKFIFMNNLPRSTTATQLAHHLEAHEYQVQSIELKETTLKGSNVMSAHVEFVTTQDATRLLRQAKFQGGLVYCGRTIYSTVDRAPNKVNGADTGGTNNDLSYVRVENATEGTSVSDIDLMDTSPSHSTASELQEEQQVNLIDEENLIMHEKNVASVLKDPFEDLIAFTD